MRHSPINPAGERPIQLMWRRVVRGDKPFGQQHGNGIDFVDQDAADPQAIVAAQPVQLLALGGGATGHPYEITSRPGAPQLSLGVSDAMMMGPSGQ